MTNSTSDFFLDNPWKYIKSPCYPDARRLYLSDERFWVSMDDTNQILFFVQDKGADKVKPLENLNGLDVSIEPYSGGEYRLICRLTSDDQELVDKFSTVAKDIAFHCSDYSGIQLFLKTQERIKSWANFLKPSRTGLSPSEFVGLFGELYMLAEHFMSVVSPEEAVRAWIGPEGKKQDFTFNNVAVEVKTSLSGDNQAIKISSLDQLDRITNKLYLARIVMSPSGNTEGINLNSLYETCLQAVKHNISAESLFLQRVSPLYSKANDSQINDFYSIVNSTVFDVVDEFPRLTRSNVDLAITNSSYEISMGALSEFIISDEIGSLINNG